MGALYYFRTKEIGVLGWEDWLLLRDGKKTHSTIQGTVSVEPESNENWSDYVNRSLNFALETIEKDHQAFLKSSESSRGKLHFCITPLTQREWVLRSNTAQKGRDLGAV